MTNLFPSLGVRILPKLLSVNAYHYRRGGSDVVYLDHAALFERRGWQNLFFSMKHPNNLPYQYDHLFAERIDYEYSTGLIDRLTAAKRIIYSRDAQRRLSSLLTNHRVDVAHIHNIYHHLSPSVLVELRRRGIPAVMTAHDLKLACPNYKMMTSDGICERCKGGRVWNTLIHRCIKGSVAGSALITLESGIHKALGLYDHNLSAIVTPSRFYQEKLIEWGWKATKLHYIPNFVTVSADVNDVSYGDHVLYFGRLAPEKGVGTLIKAAAAAKVPLVVIGNGPEEAKLRALADAIAAPVEFRGFLSGDALWQAVQSCRAVVLPSEWYENAPMSLLEAFARRRPVAGARIGGIPELIQPEATGWLFRSGDVMDLAATLQRIMDAPDSVLSEMGRRARIFLDREFGPELYYNRMTNLYRQLI